MNFKIAALIFISVGFLFDIILLIIKKIQIKKPLPMNAIGIFEESKYEKYIIYTKQKMNLSLISKTTISIIMFVLIYFDLFTKLYSLLANEYLLIISYILITTIINTFFEYFETMKIDNKFGFSTSTKKTFFSDCIIGFITTCLIISFLLFIVKLLYKLSPDYYYLFAIIIFGFLLIILFLIIPLTQKLYNKFRPLEGELRDKIEELLVKNNYKVKDISIMDASKRTTRVNAFLAGFGKYKRIGLYDNLLAKVSDEQIIAIFSHELGHAKHKDTLKNTILMEVLMIVFMLLLHVVITKTTFFSDFKLDYVNFALLLIILSEAFAPLLLFIISPVINFFSRRCEMKADKFSCDCGYGNDLYQGLKKLARENLSNLNPHPLEVLISYSHPPIVKRLEDIKKNAHLD